MDMDWPETLRWFAAFSGIGAAITVSLNFGPRATGWGFLVFTASSLTWVAAGYIEDLGSLMVQNAVLTAINLIGVYRYWSKIPAT